MKIIDEEGRLFGTVNVVDAFVVLLLLAVIGSGGTLILQADDGEHSAKEQNTELESATRYVTLDLGTQPEYVAKRITVGDRETVGGSNLTVTDVYRIPAKGGINVWARVRLDGHVKKYKQSPKFVFSGNQIRVSDGFSVSTSEYQVKGTIHSVEKNDPSLTNSSNVVLRATTFMTTASEIKENDTFTIANGTVATIKSVNVHPTKNPQRKQVLIGVTIETINVNGQRQFLGRPVRIGSTLPFQTETYDFSSTIVKLGSLTPSHGTLDIVLQTRTSREKAAAIDRNDTYKVNGNTLATVESVNVYPTSSAAKKRVVLGLKLNTIERNDQQMYLGRTVQIGQQLPFRTTEYELIGTVIHRGNTTLPGDRTTTTVRMKIPKIPGEITDSISENMTEQINSITDARVIDKRVEPATVILKSQTGSIYKRNHPTKKDIYLTVELRTRQRNSELYFHNKRLREGSNITLDLGTITVDGHVIEIDNDA